MHAHAIAGFFSKPARLAVGVALLLAPTPAAARSHLGLAHFSRIGRAHSTPGVKPVEDQDLSAPAPSSDLGDSMRGFDEAYDYYLSRKDLLKKETGIDYSMQVSNFGQWGSPDGTPQVGSIVYAPTVVWSAFKNPDIGAGTVTLGYQQFHYWTANDTLDQQNFLQTITPPAAFSTDGYQHTQLTYTHTLPGDWLSASAGIYSIGNYDQNDYAGNPQANFVNFALSSNANQTYANAGLGAFVELNPPGTPFTFAGGVQDATDLPGQRIAGLGFKHGEIAWFGSGSLSDSSGGTYSMLWYSQPSVPLQPGVSRGVSFSASQKLGDRLGAFVRVNHASGSAIPVETTIAFGGVYENPLGRNRLDEWGVGAAWSKTNGTALDLAQTSAYWQAEWVVETYYNYTIFKGVQMTPDVQFFINPALLNYHRATEVYTLRTTWTF